MDDDRETIASETEYVGYYEDPREVLEDEYDVGEQDDDFLPFANDPLPQDSEGEYASDDEGDPFWEDMNY